MARKAHKLLTWLTVKSEEHVDGEQEHEDCVDDDVGVVDVAAKQVPLVVNEGGHQRMLQ